jgi:dipeptidyl aminopeptidase/acylaminoacyl peptidase
VNGARRPAHQPEARLGLPPLTALTSPALALALLVGVALATVGLLSGELPLPGRPAGGGVTGPARTPTPSNVVVVDPRTRVPGTIVFVKTGNVWAQSGAVAQQLTSSGTDSMPAWAPDGSAVYYVNVAAAQGYFPAQGDPRRYEMAVPSLVRLRLAGEATPETLLNGRYTSGRYSWFSFIRQPAPAPNGTQVAILTDGPDPTKSDVVVKLVDVASRNVASLNLPETAPLGHQDPTWRPDGKVLAFVRPGRDGTRGAASIWRYDVASKKSSAVTGAGYLQPSWSPDGRFLAATRSDSYGTDVVILEAANGRELLRLTNDERSFGPAWSPAGDAIAFLRVERGVVDLVMVPIQPVGASWAAGEPLALTRAAGLDAGSRPSWFIPPDQLPKPTPAPTQAPVGGSPGTPGPAATGR